MSFINPLHITRTPSQGLCHPATDPSKWRVTPSSAVVAYHVELVIPLVSPPGQKAFLLVFITSVAVEIHMFIVLTTVEREVVLGY